MALPDPSLLPPELSDVPIPQQDLDVLFAEAVVDAREEQLPIRESLDRLTESEDAPRWQITDTGGAEWAMRHVAEADQAIEVLAAQAEDWTDRIRQWFEQAVAREEVRREFFAGHLERYALELRDEGTLSFTVPSGKVTTRSTKEAAQVDDADDVLEWAEANVAHELLDEFAPRKLSLSGLRGYVTLVEVIDSAQLVDKDGVLIWWTRHGYPPPEADDGDGTLQRLGIVGGEGEECPTVGPFETGEIVQVIPVDTHVEVRDEYGTPVPGVSVKPASVSVSVKPVTS
jgi:hypothetical protein